MLSQIDEPFMAEDKVLQSYMVKLGLDPTPLARTFRRVAKALENCATEIEAAMNGDDEPAAEPTPEDKHLVEF